ncbi:homoserine dehydrogenase [Chloroflexota bacterium]
MTLKQIPIIAVGVGNVGGEFLRQMLDTRTAFAERYNVKLQPVALVDLGGAIFNQAGISDANLLAALLARQNGQLLDEQPDFQAGMSALDAVNAAANLTPVITVDTTAADGMEAALLRALNLDGGIVLANKRPVAVEWSIARRIFASPRAHFEATVCAGVPVLHTLRYLVDVGDAAQHITGSMSGTLGYLCSRLEKGDPFSVIVQEAKAAGYTEPDPRDDLSGTDVARKALILARLAGWPLEMADLSVQALYPDHMSNLSVAEFMAALPELDEEFAAYSQMDGAPRYMAAVTAEGGSVGIQAVDAATAAQLSGTLNVVTLQTDRYDTYPLSLSGPGAGVPVTAAGVLQDCLALAREM